VATEAKIPAGISSRPNSLAPSDPALAEAFSSIYGSYGMVYARDAWDVVDPWKMYDAAVPPESNDLTEIDEAMGLWIRATAAVTRTLPGTVPSNRDIALHEGWNLVGYPCSAARPISEMLAGIEAKYELIYAYDAAGAAGAVDASDPWKKYHAGAPSVFNELTQMMLGFGYWIQVSQDCVWTVE